MRNLTPEEENLWSRVKGTITPLGEPRRPGFNAFLQLLNPYPSWVLDLHGMTVYEAFNRVKSFVQDAYLADVRRVTIITGKSGVIASEFPLWVERYPVQRSELLRGGGAYRVFIVKKPQKTVT
jgi:hypothetical protein